jgi:uncharacterized protein YecE (DUF72 family)
VSQRAIFVGTSGWNYDHWKGPFYPEGLAKAKWLDYYARSFQTIEVNATFYRAMKESTFAKWRRATPEGFVWAVKANRFITHSKRLRDVGEPLQRFFGSASALGDKLGPVLFQLPPSLGFDRPTLEEFRNGLPSHQRCVVEARHASWMQDEALADLRELGLGFCISDTAGRYPTQLHGPTELYASSYSGAALATWAARLAALAVDTYVYFDNDAKAYAPRNTRALIELLHPTENGDTVGRGRDRGEPAQR